MHIITFGTRWIREKGGPVGARGGGARRGPGGGEAPTDYAKPRQTLQSPRKTIQSPDRQYKAPTDNTKPRKDYTKPPNEYNKKNMYNPNILDMNQKYLTKVAI